MNLSSLFHVVSPADAPHLHAALDELCAKAGIEKPMLCIPTDKALASKGRRIYQRGIAVLDVDGPRLFIGPRPREYFGIASLDAPVSEPLKAVLAHEIGHLKHNDTHIGRTLTIRSAPFLGMAAALAGYHIYEMIKNNQSASTPAEDKKAQQQAQLEQHLDGVKQDAPWLSDGTMRIIKYVAAGALGLISGVVFSKLLQNHIEFRADRFSAELMGSGKPLIEAFKIYGQGLSKEVRQAEDTTVLRKIKSWISHPSTAERIERLRAM